LASSPIKDSNPIELDSQQDNVTVVGGGVVVQASEEIDENSTAKKAPSSFDLQ